MKRPYETMDDRLSDIDTEAELEGFKYQLEFEGRLDATARNKIEVRRHALRAAKHQ